MASVRDVADRAWLAFKRDVEAGDPGPLLELMAEDVRWRSPNLTRRFRGERVSREEYRAFSRWRWNDLQMRGTLTLGRVLDGTSARDQEGTVAYEWRVASENRGQTYRNSLCIVFDVAAGRVTGFREYVNELDPDAIANGAVEPSG